MWSKVLALTVLGGFAISGVAFADTAMNTALPAPIAPLSGMILYHDAKLHFAIAYPPHWAVNPNYSENAFGPGSNVHGVSFTVSPKRTKGTNLASDTALMVLSAPGACDAARFFDTPQAAKTVTEAGRTYSVASVSDAAAGNRTEETVYALAGTSPCLVVRYRIHYSAIENYPPGTVKAFDHDALMKTMGRMRRSLAVMK